MAQLQAQLVIGWANPRLQVTKSHPTASSRHQAERTAVGILRRDQGRKKATMAATGMSPSPSAAITRHIHARRSCAAASLSLRRLGFLGHVVLATVPVAVDATRRRCVSLLVQKA